MEKLNSRDYSVFTEKKTPVPTVAIYQKLKEISAGTSYEFLYGRTTLYHLLKKLVLNIEKQIIER